MNLEEDLQKTLRRNKNFARWHKIATIPAQMEKGSSLRVFLNNLIVTSYNNPLTYLIKLPVAVVCDFGERLYAKTNK